MLYPTELWAQPRVVFRKEIRNSRVDEIRLINSHYCQKETSKNTKDSQRIIINQVLYFPNNFCIKEVLARILKFLSERTPQSTMGKTRFWERDLFTGVYKLIREIQVIQVGVGLSQQDEAVPATLEATREALNRANLQNPDWVLVFLSTTHMRYAEDIRLTLVETTQCEKIAGCSGAGVLTNQEEVIGSSAIAVMVGASEQMPSQAFIHRQEDPDAPSVPQQLKETLEAFEAPNPLLFLFPDAYNQLPYNLINTLNYVSTKPQVFGAGACDDGSCQHSVEIGPQASFTDGVSGLCLGGMKQFIIGVTQSCSPIAEPLFITKVEKNAIISLDGYPALEVFSTLAGNQGIKDFDTAARNILLAFPLDKESPKFTGESCLVRHLSGIDVSRQGLVVPQIIEEGGILSMMYRNAITAENDLYAMLERIKTTNPNTPVFGVYFNCAARGESLYQRPNVDTEAIRETLGDFPIIGFFGGFEMASVPAGLQLYSYTGVLVLFYV